MHAIVCSSMIYLFRIPNCCKSQAQNDLVMSACSGMASSWSLISSIRSSFSDCTNIYTISFVSQYPTYCTSELFWYVLPYLFSSASRFSVSHYQSTSIAFGTTDIRYHRPAKAIYPSPHTPPLSYKHYVLGLEYFTSSLSSLSTTSWPSKKAEGAQ